MNTLSFVQEWGVLCNSKLCQYNSIMTESGENIRDCNIKYQWKHQVKLVTNLNKLVIEKNSHNLIKYIYELQQKNYNKIEKKVFKVFSLNKGRRQGSLLSLVDLFFRTLRIRQILEESIQLLLLRNIILMNNSVSCRYTIIFIK